MNEPTNRELVNFVLGTTSTDGAEHVKMAMVGNEELAAKLCFLQEFTGTTSDSTLAAITPSKMRVPIVPHPVRSWTRRAAMFLLIFLIGGGLAVAGWKLMETPPLLKENFSRNWVDTQTWATPRRSVFFSDGHARLFDRGHLVTRQEYPGPIDLRFRWKWIDLAGDLMYRDELVVALRTAGIPNEMFAYENPDGILVRFNATAGNVRINSEQDPAVPLGVSNQGSFPFAADRWYEIRIIDDGENIVVYVRDEGQETGSSERPALKVRIHQRGAHHHIAFYNRERVAAASHESWIDDVVIHRYDHQNKP